MFVNGRTCEGRLPSSVLNFNLNEPDPSVVTVPSEKPSMMIVYCAPESSLSPSISSSSRLLDDLIFTLPFASSITPVELSDASFCTSEPPASAASAAITAAAVVIAAIIIAAAKVAACLESSLQDNLARHANFDLLNLRHRPERLRQHKAARPVARVLDSEVSALSDSRAEAYAIGDNFADCA